MSERRQSTPVAIASLPIHLHAVQLPLFLAEALSCSNSFMICGTADGLSFPFDSESCPETQADLEPLIQQFDAECRLDLALYPPPISITAAIWALKFIENACRFLVYRELDEHLIADRLGPACPVPVSPACIYSVDLLMRYLPDVTRMAKDVGEDDPLVKHLQHAAARWPLSSVGMCG